VPENLSVPLEGDRDFGELCGSHPGCQVPFRPPIPNVGLLLRRCSGKGLHLAMTGEPRGFSRVTAGFSSYDGEFRMPLVLAQASPIFIRVANESWALLSSDCRANRPHLGFCPEDNVPLRGRQGSGGCIPDAPGETGIHVEWKQRTPLCSRIATGISWSSLGGPKGVKAPEAGPSPGLSHSPLVQTQEQNFSMSSTKAGDPQEGKLSVGTPSSHGGDYPPHTLFLHPGLVHWKRASPPVEAGTAGYL